MKTLAPVNAALLLSLSLTAAAAPLAMPYEAAAGAARVGLAPTQFAILHALMGWRGGSSPTYSFYRAKDEPLLAKTGIKVRPLENPTERALLEDELTKVRHDRNNGHRNLYNKSTFISPETMAERHRALIARYADRVTVGAAGSDGAKAPAPGGAEKLALFEARSALMAKLTPAMQALAGSADQASFERNLAAFNDAASGFGGGRAPLARAPGESFASVVERARGVYSAEAARLQALASESGAFLSAPAGPETLKARGAFFDGANGEKIPVAGPGSFHSAHDPNQAAPSPSSSLTSAKVAVPAPGGDARKGERKPGLFGMLGSLLGGLFRTLGRVAAALFHGALAVGKALLS